MQGLGCSSVTEHLPSTYEALDSIPSTYKIKKGMVASRKSCILLCFSLEVVLRWSGLLLCCYGLNSWIQVILLLSFLSSWDYRHCLLF
jgi:hypothetical protein